MAINQNSDFIDLCTWLNENLLTTNSFVPHIDEIPNVKSKGIYFWFMHPNGYKTLSNYVTINPINPKYTKDIDGIKYDLVYLGTAGTGKKGNSNLNERFEWHVNQNHSESNICHGTLSTLRAGLGALLAEDLIIPNTESLVNIFMKNYMKVFWIEYSNDKSLIDNDEKILIKGIKPLLNLKNNPNARANAQANTTQVYKTRRAIVYENTRLRLGCKGESEKQKKTIKTPTKNTPSFEHQIYSENDEYIEFFVLKNQSILDVVRGIEGLTNENCSFQILNSETGILISDFKGWNSTGKNVHKNPKAQNIYTYFSSTGGKIDDKETARWLHIQNRMNKKNDEIEEITVKVFSSEKLDLSKNFKVVMMCSKRKQDDSELIFNNNKIIFKAISNEINNQFKPDDNIPGNDNYSWRNFVSVNQNQINFPFQAYELYTKDVYLNLFNTYNNRLYIESAGWGIVNAEFRLPNYDITFSIDNNNEDTIRDYQLEDYHDYNQLNVSKEDDIVFIGTEKYLPLFFDLTKDLPNRKIIYWKKQNTPDNYPIPDDNFLYRYYNSYNLRSWAYELAEKIANGFIP